MKEKLWRKSRKKFKPNEEIILCGQITTVNTSVFTVAKCFMAASSVPFYFLLLFESVSKYVRKNNEPTTERALKH